MAPRWHCHIKYVLVFSMLIPGSATTRRLPIYEADCAPQHCNNQSISRILHIKIARYGMESGLAKLQHVRVEGYKLNLCGLSSLIIRSLEMCHICQVRISINQFFVSWQSFPHIMHHHDIHTIEPVHGFEVPIPVTYRVANDLCHITVW